MKVPRYKMTIIESERHGRAVLPVLDSEGLFCHYSPDVIGLQSEVAALQAVIRGKNDLINQLRETITELRTKEKNNEQDSSDSLSDGNIHGC